MTEIFVFGSNEAGRHGKGAALDARKHHGAIYGQGEGLQGHSYAIPTKDAHLYTLPLRVIETYVARFKAFAESRPDLRFKVTAIGCGLAGYRPAEIAPMFANAPANCTLPPAFLEVLRDTGASNAPLPVCVWCDERIAPGDAREPGPMHYECQLRSILGSVGHQLKQCSCYGGTREDPPNMTRRQAAVAAALFHHFGKEPNE